MARSRFTDSELKRNRGRVAMVAAGLFALGSGAVRMPHLFGGHWGSHHRHRVEATVGHVDDAARDARDSAVEAGKAARDAAASDRDDDDDDDTKPERSTPAVERERETVMIARRAAEAAARFARDAAIATRDGR